MIKNIVLIFIVMSISLMNMGCNRPAVSEAISYAVNEQPYEEGLAGNGKHNLPNRHIEGLQAFFKQYFTTSYKQGIKNYISEEKSEAFSKGHFKGWFEPPMGNKGIQVIGVEVVGMRQEETVIHYTVDVITNQILTNGEQGYMGYRYEVVAEDEEQLSIRLIQRADPLSPSQRWQLPYDLQIDRLEEEKIIGLLENLCEQDLDFFEAYEKAWHTDYEALSELMKNIKIGTSRLSLEEATYKGQYDLYLSPYKLPSEKMHFKWETAAIKIEPYSTKSSRIFSVKIEAEVLRDYNNKLYYNYEYLVGLYEGQIVSIQFIKREPCIEQKGITT